MKKLISLMEGVLDLSSHQIWRLCPFFLLAITLKSVDVAANTLTTTLFLTHVGADHLPLAYVVMGLVSVPIYFVFSRLTEARSRTQLLFYILGGSMLMALVLRVLLESHMAAVYYVGFTLGSFVWEGAVIFVLFPTLVADYFTATEYKRFAWLLAIALALGSLLGGSVTSLLATMFTVKAMLIGLSIVYGMLGAQVYWLSRTQSLLPHTEPLPDDSTSDDLVGRAEAGNLERKKQRKDAPWWVFAVRIRRLLKRYPLILLLVVSILVQVVLSTLSRFQYLEIYARSFESEQALTQFISALAIGFSLLEITILYGFTRPLIRKLGVPRMQLVYPLTTLLSFVGLTFNGQLPAAVAANLNVMTLSNSIDEPVNALTYNALPPRLVGKVRALTEGICYALGMALAGATLWRFQHRFTLQHLFVAELVFGGLFVLARYKTGQAYLRALQLLLHNRFKLTQARLAKKQIGSPTLTSRHDARSLVPLMRIMLRKSPTSSQQQLLERALQLAQPGNQQLANLALVEIHHPEPQVVVTALKLLGKTQIDYLMPYVAEQLEHLHPVVRAAAATALAEYGESGLRLAQDYLMSQRAEVVEAAIGAIAQVKTRKAADILYRYLQPAYTALTSQSLDQTLDPAHWQFIHQLLAILSDLESEADILPIRQSLQDTDVRVRARGLELLSSLRHRRFVMPILSKLEDAVHRSPLPKATQKSIFAAGDYPVTPVSAGLQSVTLESVPLA